MNKLIKTLLISITFVINLNAVNINNINFDIKEKTNKIEFKLIGLKNKQVELIIHEIQKDESGVVKLKELKDIPFSFSKPQMIFKKNNEVKNITLYIKKKYIELPEKEIVYSLLAKETSDSLIFEKKLKKIKELLIKKKKLINEEKITVENKTKLNKQISYLIKKKKELSTKIKKRKSTISINRSFLIPIFYGGIDNHLEPYCEVKDNKIILINDNNIHKYIIRKKYIIEINGVDVLDIKNKPIETKEEIDFYNPYIQAKSKVVKKYKSNFDKNTTCKISKIKKS